MAANSNCASTPCCLLRYWNAGAGSPCAISGCAAPSRSSMSRVGGWKVEARDSSLRSDPASSTVTGTPLSARLAAAVRPTGPAPATSTRSWSLTPLLDLRDAGLGDDVPPFHRFVGDEFFRLLRRHDIQLRADLEELLAHGGIRGGGGQFVVELGDDRLRGPARRLQGEPAGRFVLRQSRLGGGRHVGQGLQSLLARHRQRAGTAAI